MTEKIIKKIEDFLDNNSLDFESTGSGLNSSCTVISGFALFCGITDCEDFALILTAYLEKNKTKPSLGLGLELERVFEYAQNNNYGKFWETGQAKLEYKF